MTDPHAIAMRQQAADHRWIEAMTESSFAPPDEGFAERLRKISAAAAGEAAWLYEAANSPRMEWTPARPGKGRKRLTYELRPEGNRPGPAELWERFDEAVDAIALAQTGSDFTPIAAGFQTLADITAQLADAVDDERGVRRARAAG
jgi:hypothetical protein